MKRNEALLKLSREHHTGLIMAQLLKRNAPAYQGLPSSDEDKFKYLSSMLKTHLRPHFEQEEKIIGYLDSTSETYKPMHARILSEHQTMLSICEKFRFGTDDMVEYMDTFGRLLEKHIRFEEREYFEFLQRHASEEDFEYIKNVLEPGNN